MVQVCYCKLLYDVETYIKAVAWELLIRSMKYAVLKPCLTVKDDASCDIIQALQTFRGMHIILSVVSELPQSPYFTQHIAITLDLYQCFCTVGLY